MWRLTAGVLWIVACGGESAPPVNPHGFEAMGGPAYAYTTTILGDAAEGSEIIVQVTGPTLQAGDIVDVYRGRTYGAGGCFDLGPSGIQCLEITDHEQYIGGATTYEVSPGVFQADIPIIVPYSAQTELIVQAIVVIGGAPGMASPTSAPILPGPCDDLGLPFGGGSGTEVDPYLICAAEQWANMEGGGAWFRLESDLILRRNEQHIEALYAANLDGGEYTVHVSPSDRALFGYVDQDSQIRDLGVSGIDVVSNENAAGVVEWLDGRLSGISASGNVAGPNSFRWSPDWRDYTTGGLVATAGYSSVIEGIDADMEVLGGNRVGGVVGYTNGRVENVWAEVYVRGEASVGGIVGYADTALVAYAFVAGTVEGAQCFVGGAIGRGASNGEGELLVVGVYSEADVSGERTDVGGIAGGTDGGEWISLGVENAEISSSGTRTGGAFGTVVNADVAGVSLTSVDVWGDGRYTGGYAGVDASFGANGISATNMYIDGDMFGVGGLVGYHINGVLSNVYFEGSIDGSGSAVGGLVGINGAIPNVTDRPIRGWWMPFVETIIEPDISAGESYVSLSADRNAAGGLVGLNFLGNIVNSVAAGFVYSEEEDAGGLVGTMLVGSITDSGSYANIESGIGPAGGLVGAFHSTGTITRSYALGDVYAGAFAAGGFVGVQSSGLITESFSHNSVFASDSVAGGFIGAASGDGLIRDCYTSSNVEVTGSGCMEEGVPVGGFIGGTMNYQLHVQDSYALNDSLYYAVEASGNRFLGGRLCGQDGDSNLAVVAGYYDDSLDTDPWAGTEPIGGPLAFLSSYPTLGAAWSEASYNPYSPSYTAGSVPALSWQCAQPDVSCGLALE